MLTNTQIQEIEEYLYNMSWEELQETLIQVELMAALKENKIVFSGTEGVQ